MQHYHFILLDIENGSTFNFDKCWVVLEDSVLKIQRQEKTVVTCEDLYNVRFFVIFMFN